VFAATSSSVNVNQQEITSAAREVASRVASDVTSSNFNSTLNAIRSIEPSVSVNLFSNTNSLKSHPLQFAYLVTFAAAFALAYF
jgi:hypothetical protein